MIRIVDQNCLKKSFAGCTCRELRAHNLARFLAEHPDSREVSIVTTLVCMSSDISVLEQ